MESIEHIVEELTVQQVILESMADETWDGIAKERQEVTDKIEELNLLLRQMERNQPRTSDNDAATSSFGDSTLSGPSSYSRPEPRTPALPAGRSINMETPQRDDDPWSSPLSLPSRKRELVEAESDITESRNKSRRTTPVPGGNHVSPFFTQRTEPAFREEIHMIDLTGDDTESDALAISQQVRQTKRLEQENLDRQLALKLSGEALDEAPSSDPPGASNEAYAGRSFFSKMMDTQRSNARGPTDRTHSPMQSMDAPTVAMPGAYDPSWDSTGQWQHGTPAPAFNIPGVSLPMSRGPLKYLVLSPSQRPGLQQDNNRSAQRSSPQSQMALNARQRAMAQAIKFAHAQRPPGHSGSSISSIIDHTASYDYANGVDQHGNLFNSRLTNVLTDDYESAVTGKELDDLLKNIRPDIEIPEHNREIRLEGLRCPLYRHQGVALTWMKQMEEGTNKGGILADDMGLGKTVSTLALILANPSTCRPKTNLIIGPLSLVRQWEEEIKKKIRFTSQLSVFVYHNRKPGTVTTHSLLKYDVVLTTYGTIAQDFRRYAEFNEKNKHRNIDFNDRSYGSTFPLFHQEKAMFHRVILDEAQCIKNRRTKTAEACHHLKATYKWCLTGTPMMNGVLELYSLLKFLNIKPYSSWEHFRQAFGVLFGMKGDPKSVAMSRLRALLKAVMLRRKKDSKLDGKPILQLPAKNEHIVYAEFSTDERDFYKQLEEKAQVMFSKYLREGSIGKNYSNILVLLLRLRQACCHPHLNLDVDDAAPAVSNENMEQLVKDLDKLIVDRIKKREAFECPICYDAVQSPCFFIPCGHDSCKDCLIRITDNAVTQNIREGNESNSAKCPVCRGSFDPKKCFTHDLFKKVHMPETVEKLEPVDDERCSEEDESDESEGDDLFDDDVDSKGNLKGFVVEDGADDTDDNEDKDLVDLQTLTREALVTNQKERSRREAKKQKNKKKDKGKGKEKKSDVRPSMLKSLRLEAVKNRDAYQKYMRYLRKTWMPAAKVTECMGLLRQIGESGDKTIVFSQWTLLLDLLEVAIWHEKFDYRPLRYDGSMSGDQRSASAQSFRDNPKIKVMLVSLRAGNAGLNLTVANRVIIMDPFWNPYIEMQAIDRTYRIGQMKEVQVYRILTQKTVEDRIVQLQEKKKEIVEAALDENESMKIGRLNVNELKFLFNTN
ncbi:hypothetical protein QQS21_011437 [Conoideocrella luteorostrata]|uniref:Uncharacterized protein n=1 Tax=Conoideocrella luteorostrata TaxID=1105319 RepID=A0AAJ0CFF7_9HYPO|nr:hypothetical protein QQS21_011437 [Conoideocrella luteorostrata]